MKQYVSGEPYISETVIESTDTHLILACDGVWDVLSDQDAVTLILRYETCKEAAKQLLIQSLRSGSTDNISVIVIKL
jgi:protein phosphatase PTC1